MERYFTPPATQLPPATSVLVLAPHADDEVFGCGGLLSRLAEQGAYIHVIVMTRPDDDGLAQRRHQESRLAADRLGYAAPTLWTAKDGRLPDTQDMVEALNDWLEEADPDLILAPSPWEMHRDHRRVCEAAILACQSSTLPTEARLAFYEVGQPLTPNLLVDITSVQEGKRAAMSCFASQQALQDYIRHIQALNVYRTYSLPSSVSAAEAFTIVPVNELNRFAERLDPERLSTVVWHADQEVSAFRAEQQRLQHDLESVQADARQLFEDKQALLGSLSWRVTRPLRDIARGLREPSRILRHLLRLLPPPLRSRLATLYRHLEQRAQIWVTSKSQDRCRQDMLDRRLATLDSPLGGWRTICQTPPVDNWPRITLSIVTYNSADWLPGLLKSLLDQHYPLERLGLVFVDNGSRDGTLATLATFRDTHAAAFDKIEIHELANPGFGAAHNHAIRHSDGDLVLITNPDLEFLPETLTSVVAMAMADAEDVASWELRQVPYEHPKHYDPVSWEALWSSHACILIRRSIFETLGGYDERIFLYGEDVEFSFRCREAGYRLRYCPLARVMHHTYGEAHEVKPAQYLGSTRANLFLRLRYGSRRDVAAGLLLSMASLFRSPFPSARKRLLGEFRSLLGQARGLRRDYRQSLHQNIGIFRGLDYDMVRAGAFEPAPQLPQDSELPLISVITRTYQGRDWLLQQAGRSVLQQTWPNLEWIVVEDGGESCREIVASMAESAPCAVRYIHQPKRGRSHAGNLGLAEARGRWCLFLDDDDLLYADHLETLAGTLLADVSLSAAYSLAWDISCDINPESREIRELAYVQHKIHVQPFDLEELAWRNYIPIQAILFERRLYERHGGFREYLDQLEDWNLWRRYANGASFHLVNKITSLYRTPAHQDHNASRQADLDAAYQRVKEETDAELSARALQ